MIFNFFLLKKNLDLISLIFSTFFFYILFRYDLFSFYSPSFLDNKVLIFNYYFTDYSKNLLILFASAFLIFFMFNINFKDLNNIGKYFLLFHLIMFLFVVLFKFDLEQHFKYNNINLNYLVCLIGFFAIKKPALIIVPIFYTIYRTNFAGIEMSTYNSNLDYITFAYYIIFFLLSLSIFKYLNVCLKHFKFLKITNVIIKDEVICFFVIISSAIHIAVYFNSGIGKVIIGDYDFFYWIKNNQTFFLTAHAQLSGLFNYGDYLPSQFFNEVFIKYNLFINFLVLFFQLISPFGYFNKKIYLFILVFFELQHIIIFLTTGIFFWKWALFNILIFFLITNKNFIYPLNFKKKVFCIIFTFFFFIFFNIPRFAWLDTNYVNQIKINIIDKKNKIYEVPSNFFLNKSVLVSQNFPGQGVNSRLNNTFIWGSVRDKKLMEKINTNCEDHLEEFIVNKEYLNFLQKKIREYILLLKQKNNNINYDFYPHHIWSSFTKYKSFKQLSIDNMVKFQISMESYCHRHNKDYSFTKTKEIKKTFTYKIGN